ncbi:MAG: transcriptional regulator, tetR family [Actinomycetia bacterium]|nr:transcriptional regulator, tetR family [Actinomycetes bacterium]
MDDTPPLTLREHAREAVRRQIARTAIDLFEERGVEDVTVDDIVTAAGTSARTFHRYFTAKEETVLVDSAAHGRLVADALGRQAGSDPWAALRQSLQPLVDAADTEVLRTTRVLLSTPSLRARSMQKHRDWADVLVPILRVADRLDETEARALVLSALSCFDVALEEWTSHAGARPLGEILDRAFRAVGYR